MHVTPDERTQRLIYVTLDARLYVMLGVRHTVTLDVRHT